MSPPPSRSAAAPPPQSAPRRTPRDGAQLRQPCKVAHNKREEKQERAAEYADSELSKRILQLAKVQQDEIVSRGARGSHSNRRRRFPGKDGRRAGEVPSSAGRGRERRGRVRGRWLRGLQGFFNRSMPQDGHPPGAEDLARRQDPGEHEAKLAGAGGTGNAKDDTPALPPKAVDV